MSTTNLLFYAGLILVVGLVFYLLLTMRELKLAKTSPHKWFDRPLKEQDKKQKIDEFYQKAYVFFLRIPLLRRMVLIIRRRLETSTSMHEYTLRREIMRVISRVVVMCLVVFILFLMVNPSLVLFIWMIVGLALLAGVFVDLFVYKVEFRLLEQLKEYMEHIRFNYQQTKMIDESVYEAMQQCGPEMRIQAEKMYNMLNSNDMYKELEEYENVAPNRFLKTIASLQVFVSDQGDVFNENGSAFLRGLTSLAQEINDEILYRSKLHYSLRALGVLSVVPMFCVIPLRDWAVTYFPALNMFYNSWIGFVTQVLVYLSTLVAYLLIRKLIDKVIWEEKLLKFKPFAWLIRTMTPEDHQKRFYKLNTLIKEANEKIEVKHLYVRRVITSVLVFLVLILGSFYVHHAQKQSILYDTLPNTMLTGNLTEDELEKYEQLTANDRKIILALDKVDAPSMISTEAMNKIVKQYYGYDSTNPENKIAVDRIQEKWTDFKNAYFKWWELLVSICIGAVGFWTPIWILKLQRMIRIQEMENEVSQFYVLIGILREFESMSVETVLLWMERFSVVFKDVLKKGLQDFDSGQVEALQWMREEATFIPFTQIIIRLESAVTKSSIQEAFDDSDVEREFYLLQRRDNNERTIKERSLLGGMIGLMPANLLVFLYVMIPFLWVAMVQMTDMVGQLGMK